MKKILKVAGHYIFAGICSSLVLFFVLKLWNADLAVPFVYNSDGLLCLMLIKGTINNGWFLHNSFVGMPSGLDFHDFHIAESFHLLFIKLISLLFPEPATAMNIYYLLTFPLTTITSLFVFRYFKFSYGNSILGSLLFTFLPYHLLRGEHHLFLSAYYSIPLMVMIILLLFRNGGFVFKYSDEKKNRPKLDVRDSKFLMVICLCILIGSTGVYYAFFGCFFLLVAGILGVISKKRFYPLLASAILVSIISIVLLVNIAPSILYTYKYGKNIEGIKRDPVEAEIYGMKVIQLILPINRHRVPYIDELTNRYNNPHRPLINENYTSSLGAIGSFGFLILIGWLFFKKPQALNSELKTNLSILNASGVFLATVGGFGALFAFLLPQIRAYNRISVYIAFFSFFAVVILLEEYYHKHVKSIKRKGLFYLFLTVLLAIGILDETTKYMVPDYSSIKGAYLKDANFINKIESSFPKNAMIFQLPYIVFPESLPVNKMGDYEHFKGYIHSKTLRWSYGTMRGREGELWQRWATSKPLNDFLETISLAGFTGIYLDRYGYSDGAAEIEKRLTRHLNVNPIVSDDNRLAFYDMQDFSERLKAKYVNAQKPSSILGLKKLQQMDLPVETKGISYTIEVLREAKDYIDISGWAFINRKSSEESMILLGLSSDRNSYLINTSLIKRPDVTAFFQTLNFNDSGFTAIVAKEEIEVGTYKVGIYIKKDNIEAFQVTDKVLRIQE